MNLKNFIILFLLLIPLSLNAQTTNNKIADETSLQNLSPTDERQNVLIQKLDSTITHLKNENAYLKQLAEKDIDHAKSLINTTEVIVGFIAILLAIFTVVGGFIIARMFRQSSHISQDHKILKEDWEKTRKEIEDLKESFKKENKEFLQILFFSTEGDHRFDENPEDAIYYYNQALNIRKNNPEVSVKLGHAYIRIGKTKEALDCLKKAYQNNKKDVSILNAIARAYRKAKEYKEAEKFYKMAYKIKEDHIWVLSGLGQIYIHNKDFNNAEKIYKNQMDLENSFFPILNLAFVYLGMNESEQAKKYFERTIDMIDEKLDQSSEKKLRHQQNMHNFNKNS